MCYSSPRYYRLLLFALAAAGVSGAQAGCSIYDDSLLATGGAHHAGAAGRSAGTAGRTDGSLAGVGAAPSEGGAGAGRGGAAAQTDAGAAGQGEGGTAGQGEGGAPDPIVAGAANGGAPNVGKSLRHRYSFSGTGVNVLDSVGGAPGTVLNTQLDGSGILTLAGGTLDQYVDLPNGVLSASNNATFEIWFTWSGATASWQRIFDLGSSDMGEGIQGSGATYLFLSPSSNTSRTRVTVRTSGTNGEIPISDVPCAIGTPVSLAVVIDDDNDTMSLYRDGAFRAAVAYPGHLADIQDVNNWLGRSQFKADAAFAGSYDEFRIYDSALSASAVALSFSRGPDATFEP